MKIQKEMKRGWPYYNFVPLIIATFTVIYFLLFLLGKYGEVTQGIADKISRLTINRMVILLGRIEIPIPNINLKFINSLTALEKVFLVSALLGRILTVCLFVLGVVRLFLKADIKWWKAFIPIINLFCLLQLLGTSGAVFACMYGIGGGLICFGITKDILGCIIGGAIILGLANVSALVMLTYRFGHVIVPKVIVVCIVVEIICGFMGSTTISGELTGIILLICNLLLWLSFVIILWDGSEATTINYPQQDKARIISTVAIIVFSLLPLLSAYMRSTEFQQLINSAFDSPISFYMGENREMRDAEGTDEEYSAETKTKKWENEIAQNIQDVTYGNRGAENNPVRTVCPICGGTGVQYIPNLYYDPNMGWQGGNIGCGGCGGSGYIG